MKTLAVKHLVCNFVEVAVLSQPMNRLTVEVVGIDMASFLASWDGERPDSSKHVVQHITRCETLDNPLVFGCYATQVQTKGKGVPYRLRSIGRVLISRSRL